MCSHGRPMGESRLCAAAPAHIDEVKQVRMGQCNVRNWTDDLLPLVDDPSDPLGVLDLTTHTAPQAVRGLRCITPQLRPGGAHFVGLTGFEPATPTPPVWCATKLRHSPIRYLNGNCANITALSYGPKNRQVTRQSLPTS